MTRSAGLISATPLSTFSTTPANSAPGENGNGGLCWYLPAIIRVSKKLSATALTATTASPGPARGGSISSSLSASGGPKWVQRTAFMRQSLLAEKPAAIGRSFINVKAALGKHAAERVGLHRRSPARFELDKN